MKHELPEIPIWMRLIIMFSLISAFFYGLAVAEHHSREKRQENEDKRTIRSFSRFSDSDKVQEAYNRLYPLNQIK